jgi:predicted dehydrogenase
MTTTGSIRVAVVGLGFGVDFAPIYQCHPDVQSIGLCDSDQSKLAAGCDPTFCVRIQAA